MNFLKNNEGKMDLNLFEELKEEFLNEINGGDSDSEVSLSGFLEYINWGKKRNKN